MIHTSKEIMYNSLKLIFTLEFHLSNLTTLLKIEKVFTRFKNLNIIINILFSFFCDIEFYNFLV